MNKPPIAPYIYEAGYHVHPVLPYLVIHVWMSWVYTRILPTVLYRWPLVQAVLTSSSHARSWEWSDCTTFGPPAPATVTATATE